jgi:plastocyanin
MRRRLWIQAAGALMMLGLIGGCGGGDASTDTTTAPVAPSSMAAADQSVTETDTSVVITITGLAFPAEVTVPAGKSVNWVNDSSAPHEVQMETIDGAPADVEPVRLGTDQEGEISLDPGTWTYFCTIHPSMTGSLIVEA